MAKEQRKTKLPSTKRSANAVKNLGADKETSSPIRTCARCSGSRNRNPDCRGCGGKGRIDLRMI